MTARDYAKVLPSFWTGTTGKAIRALGADCQVVALYLMTSPHASAIGLYHLPLAYLCADTGSPLEGARKALRSLSEVSFCHYDEPSETVWIPEMARHQVGESVKATDNRRPWLVKEAERMRKRPFFNEFLSKYGEAFSLGLASERKPLGSPLEAPSKALRSLEQEKEQEKEQEQEPECAPEPTPAAAAAPVEAMVRSFDAPTAAESTVAAVVSETRQAAGGGPYRPRTWQDREAVQKLAAWSSAPEIGPDRLRAALASFWAAKGTGASLRWMTEEDPGRWLGSVPRRSRPEHRPAKPNEAYQTDMSDLERALGVPNG